MGWRSRDVIRSAALVMGLYFLLQLLWFANSLFLVVFLGVLFGVAVGAAVDRVERLRIGRFRIRRGVASALIVFGTLGALVGVGALMAPTLGEQFSVLRRQIPAAVDRAEEWINTHRTGFAGMILTGLAGQPAPAATPVAHGPTRGPNTAPNTTPNTAANQAPNTAANQAPNTAPPSAAAPSAAANLKARLGTQLSGAAKFLFPFLSSAAAVAAGLVLIIFLAIYIGAEPQLYHDGLMHLFPHRARERGGQVLTEMAIVLRKWLVTQLIAMVAIGSVTTIVMLLLGVKAAFALGFIAGLLEFIPTVGPILSAIPALAMGFADSPEKAVSVLIAYWGIQFLENNLLIPFLMRGGMDLPPALTLVAQALMTLVFGFLGLMVAVPLTAAAMVPIKMLYVQDVVGDNLEITNGDDDEDDDDP
jgi:predicted PurR-regulated permease PerM